MEFNYPAAQNCAFANFPTALEVRLGSAATTLLPSATLGSKLILRQTPTSGVLNGNYVTGSAIPSFPYIYTDTGLDDTFSIKLKFEGYYSFYKTVQTDEKFRFFLVNYISIYNSNGIISTYKKSFDYETLVTQQGDENILINSGAVVSFNDSSDMTYGSSYIFAYGSYYYMHNGSTLTITTGDGTSKTITCSYSSETNDFSFTES